MSKRYPELDLLRTLAIISMIAYHTLYDLVSFYGFSIDIEHGGWWLMARGTANLFLLLVGISFAISYSRTAVDKRLFKYLKRGLFVLGCGYLVSIATYVVDPVTYVRFGILHLIGVSILILPVFAKKETCASHVFTRCVVAIAVIIAGHYVRSIPVESSWLLPFGLIRPDFASVDYFPLLPWFGTVLIGLVIGQFCYVDHVNWRSKFSFLETKSQKLEALSFPGRYALPIYLLHQPVILLILWMIV